MRLRLTILAVLLTVVAAACSSGTVDASAPGADADNEGGTDTNVSSTDNDDGDGTDGSRADDSDADAAPQTTFVPNVTGPFDLDDGADRGTDDGVIIDAKAAGNLPQPLASYTSWSTDWTRRTVEDWAEFGAGLRGSDPRDGIPPIDTPVFETTVAAGEWLDPREPGALVQFDGEARFYPLGILTRHEIVNDAIDDVPIAVTFCPLCNTAITFDRRVDGDVLRFGVSGLLRNSDLVMWDSETTSLWQQITGEAVVGEYAGAQLDIISTSIVSFEQFRDEFPDGRSLAAESGFGRSRYNRNAYAGYSSLDRPFLFDGSIDDSLPALSRVVGLVDSDPIRAYPFSVLSEQRVVNDVVGDQPVVVLFGGDTADALDEARIADSRTIGTAVALDPVVDGTALTFAVGEQPDTFVDDQTGSTWSVLGLAIDGELDGTRLEPIPHRNEFWFAWQAFFGTEGVYEG